MTSALLLNILLILVLILVNSFFAAAEIALVSARRPRMQQLAEDGNPAARTVLRLVEEPARFLSTIQVGITLAGFFASAVGAIALSAALGAALAGLPGPLGAAADTLALVIITLIISFASIVLGELVPKTLAIKAADRIALLVARPVALLARVARPIVALLTGTTNLLLQLAGSQQRATLPSITTEELLSLLETGKDEGVIAPAEAAMTEGVFGLGVRRAREIMAPRVDLAALPRTATLAEARRFVFECGHSRVPVYDGDLDHIVGIVHAKDLLHASEDEAAGASVEALAQPPYYVPESVLVSDLLQRLQREHRHLAVVIDEHGGTAGIVTLEDVLEEIVGEIADEYDPATEPRLRSLGPEEAIVSGSLSVADLNDALEVELFEAGVDTIGGLVTARLERFARPGDVVDLGEVRAEVLAVNGRRIRRVRIVRTPRSSQEEATSNEQ
jgi:putative hemolysin